MAENSGINDNHGVVLNVENDDITRDRPTLATKTNHESGSRISLSFMKKVSPHLRVSAAFMQKVILIFSDRVLFAFTQYIITTIV